MTVSDSYSIEVLTSKLDKDVVNISAKIDIRGEKYQPQILTKLDEDAGIEISNFKWSFLVSNSGSQQ